MSNLKINIRFQINKSLQCLIWDRTELKSLVDHVFSEESDTDACLHSTKEILDSLTADVEKIRMLLGLLED